MENLKYKGVKSTRFMALIAINILAVVFLWAGKILSSEWVELVKWSFLFYAGSEVGAKAATAYTIKS